MSKNLNQVNGDISPESAQKSIKRLTHELSNTKREKQLSEQMRSQLEKIRVITTDINDITYKLLQEIEDLNESEVEELHKKGKAKKDELKKFEERLQMLRYFESSEIELNVEFLPNKKSNKKNVLIINNREIFVDKNEDNNESDDNTDIDDNEYESTKCQNRSRNSNCGTERTQKSWISLECESKEFKPNRSGRKRVIPQRFESFPKDPKK